jgi:hypothetical protein
LDFFMVMDNTAILTMLSPALGQRFVVLFPNTENGITRIFLGEYVAEVQEDGGRFYYSCRHGSESPLRDGHEYSMFAALAATFGALNELQRPSKDSNVNSSTWYAAPGKHHSERHGKKPTPMENAGERGSRPLGAKRQRLKAS